MMRALFAGPGFSLVGVAVLCQLGCATDPSPQIELPSAATVVESPRITAFAARLHLRHPLPPASGNRSEVRSFDRAGNVVSRRPLTPVEEREIATMVRALLERVGGNLPSASPGSGNPPSTRGPLAAAPADTILTFEFDNTTYEMEAVTTSGMTVLAITDPADVPEMAGWASFVESGDTTSFTGIVSQLYQEGILAEEVYASSGVLGALNEEIFEAAPPAATPGCDAATTAARNATIVAAVGWIVALIAPSPWTLAGALTATGTFFAASRYYACECQQRCAATAPRFSFEGAYSSDPLKIGWNGPWGAPPPWRCPDPLI